MDLKGNILVFVNTTKNGNKTFSTTISRKDKDGKYTNLSVDVAFDKKFGEEKLSKLTEENAYSMDATGFLTNTCWIDKEGKRHIKPLIYLQEASVVKVVKINKKSNDLPF